MADGKLYISSNIKIISGKITVCKKNIRFLVWLFICVKFCAFTFRPRLVTFHYGGKTPLIQNWNFPDGEREKTLCSSSWVSSRVSSCVCLHLNLSDTSSMGAPWTNRARGQDTQECLKLVFASQRRCFQSNTRHVAVFSFNYTFIHVKSPPNDPMISYQIIWSFLIKWCKINSQAQ